MKNGLKIRGRTAKSCMPKKGLSPVQKQILRKVESIWKKYPQLRFCQLVGNCSPATDNYYIDVELLKALGNTYDGKKK